MESPDTMSGMPTAPVPVPQTVRLSRHWLAAILIAAVLSFVGKVDYRVPNARRNGRASLGSELKAVAGGRPTVAL